MDPDISRWVLEFLFRSTVPDSLVAKTLTALPLSGADSRLKKTMLLRTLQSFHSNASITEPALEIMEVIEEIDLNDAVPITDSMRRAFCAVAVECTVKYLTACPDDAAGNYFAALRRIWRGRVGKMESAGLPGGLFSEELARWRNDLEAAVLDARVCERLIGLNSRTQALNELKVYLKEAWESLGPSFLDSVAVMAKANGLCFNFGGDSVRNPNGGLEVSANVDGNDDDAMNQNNDNDVANNHDNDDAINHVNDDDASNHVNDDDASNHDNDDDASNNDIDGDDIDGDASNHDNGGDASNHDNGGDAGNHDNGGDAGNHDNDGDASNHDIDGDASNHDNDSDAINHDNDGDASDHDNDGDASNHDNDDDAINHNNDGDASNPDIDGYDDGGCRPEDKNPDKEDDLEERVGASVDLNHDLAAERDTEIEKGNLQPKRKHLAHTCPDSIGEFAYGGEPKRKCGEGLKGLTKQRRDFAGGDRSEPDDGGDRSEPDGGDRSEPDDGGVCCMEDVSVSGEKQQQEQVEERVETSVHGNQELGGCDSPAQREKEIQKDNLKHRFKHTALRRCHRGVKLSGNEEVEPAKSCRRCDSVPSAEVKKVRESLKSSSLELQALVKDPLPDALQTSEVVRSKLAVKGINQNGDVDVDVPDPIVCKSIVPFQPNDANLVKPSFVHCSNNVRRPNLLERKATARTYQWDDSLDNSPQVVQPRKKKRKWTSLEEDTLRDGVKMFGEGSWAAIRSFYSSIFENRSGVDLKDKWRNMMR